MNVVIDPAEFREVIERAVRSALEERDRRERQMPAGDEPDEPLLLDSKGAAKLLSVSDRCIEDWRRRGLLDSVRAGRLRRYRRSDLERVAQEGIGEDP